MSDETKQTDAPIASGADEWWRAAAGNVDTAEREKQAADARQYAAGRLYDYVSGFTQPPQYDGRAVFHRLGRMWDWR